MKIVPHRKKCREPLESTRRNAVLRERLFVVVVVVVTPVLHRKSDACICMIFKTFFFFGTTIFQTSYQSFSQIV